ncbi:hypothetical protein JDV02_003049 [Purpureocillium takamizusanense]|uniref:Uncharacterized protein n=1 Tax=Purpureocillium takamizusanense TaxID=2060973 RepID=A0A9Q8QD82_9HYPO|nr:uncharacterized protein JDV02_003049 [Purpureocillium takamizusanense]UNI16627.1 hypothetical protein JDV02_003049 [Purpureocillium takamizusanense]
MKRLLLLPRAALVGAAAAAIEHITLPVFDNAVVKALNPTDPGYTACRLVSAKVNICVSSAGGPTAISTAEPLALAKCACCDGTNPVAAAYSSCAVYLSTEAPEMSSQYSAYTNLASLCRVGNANNCAGTSGAATVASVTDSPSSVTSGATGTIPITSVSGLGNVAPACSSMFGLYESCSKNVPGFANAPYGVQAPCYCCVTLRGEATWTDQLDKYAQTCRDWAKASGPSSIYTVAKTFAGFCQNFSDACFSTSTLATNEATATATAATTSTDAPVTSKPQSSPTTTTAAPTTTGGAASLRIGSAAGLVVAAVIAVVL